MENNRETFKGRLRQDRYTKLLSIPVEIINAFNWGTGDIFDLDVDFKNGEIKIKKIADAKVPKPKYHEPKKKKKAESKENK